jgi:hypothetical protein
MLLAEKVWNFQNGYSGKSAISIKSWIIWLDNRPAAGAEACKRHSLRAFLRLYPPRFPFFKPIPGSDRSPKTLIANPIASMQI